MSTAGMNLFDLTSEQLKRAASIKEQIDGLNKQLRGILGGPATSRAGAAEKSHHERFCEKEDCCYSEGKMGKGSKFETDDRFCQTGRQHEENESGGEGGVVGKTKGVLGG